MKKIFQILDYNEKLRLLLIIFLILTTSILEVGTLLFIQPLLNIFLNSKIESLNFKFLSLNYSFSNTLLFIAFISVFLLRNVFYAFTSYFKNKFIANIYINVSNKIYSNYLHKDYIFFLKNNSSKLISNILNEIHHFCYNVIDSYVIFLTEIFLVFAIIFFLFHNFFLFTSILLLFCFLLFSLCILIYRKKLKFIGLQKSASDKNKVGILQMSFHVIQAIKLDGIESFFLNKFNQNNSKSAKLLSFLTIFNEQIKPLWEILILISFSITIYVAYNFFGLLRADLVLVLGTFTIAFFRFLPSLNRILNCFNYFKFYAPSIDLIYEELSQQNKTIVKPKEIIKEFKFCNEIELKNVSFSYDNKNLIILDNVNLTIKHNSITFIKGESGSGKSTLLNIICGLLSPTTGQILIDNQNIYSFLKSYQGKIGYVPQKTLLFDDTVLNNIIFGHHSENIDLNLVKTVIKNSKLNKLIDKLPNGINTVIGEKGSSISGGEQQRIGIARALYKKPEILILDEATSALDEKNENDIIREILELSNDITIIIVAHKKIEIEKKVNYFELINSKLCSISIKK